MWKVKENLLREGSDPEVTLAQSTSHTSQGTMLQKRNWASKMPLMCFGVLSALRQNSPSFDSSQLTCSVWGKV